MTLTDLRAGMFTAGAWYDITTDIRQDPGVQITRGRSSWSAKQSTPMQATFQLANGADCFYGAGAYDPRNPGTSLYGLFGKGTPIRVGVATAKDAFGRTVASGWGTSDSGYVYADGVVGTTAGAVGSGVATHTVSTVSSFRRSTLTGFSQRDMDLTLTCTLAMASVTGGAVEPLNVVWRFQDSSNYYFARVSVATTGAITLDIRRLLAGVETVLTSTSVATGLTHAAGTPLSIRIAAEGNAHRARVWQGSAEPYTWLLTAVDTAFGSRGVLDTGGSVGVRSGVAAGNTNIPVTFTYDNLLVQSPRFAGEIAELAQRRDKSNRNAWAEVTAAGAFRRLGSGRSPVDSTLRRFWTKDTSVAPIAYWPCEEGRSATQVESGLAGGFPMVSTAGSVGNGTPRYGVDTTFASSEPLLQCVNSPLAGTVRTAPDTGFLQLVWMMTLPQSGLVDLDTLVEMRTTGTVSRWQIDWRTGGGLTLRWFDRANVAIADTGSIAFGYAGGQKLVMSLELTQSGANVNYVLKGGRIEDFQAFFDSTTWGGGLTSGTVVSQTFEHAYAVFLDTDGELPGVGLGHVGVTSAYLDLSVFGLQQTAYVHERAHIRATRLATENDYAIFARRYDDRAANALAQTAPMGPQLPKKLLDLIEECAVADNAIYAEHRGNTFAFFRPGYMLANQNPTLSLDVVGSQIAVVPDPVDDDSDLVNLITAAQPEGSEIVLEQTTGRLSTAPPESGGVGIYDQDTTLNVHYVRNLYIAGSWLLHLGTADLARYPKLTVYRHDPEITGTQKAIDLLDVDLGDLIAVAHLDHGNTRSLMALGYTENITALTHQLTFNCAPGEPWRTGRVGSSGHKVDTGNSTLASSATTTATSLSVASNGSSPRWIDSATYASEFPFDVMVAGERMTVTAISGTSSPQTFTVTRSVNAVVKAQASGAALALADPRYASLGTVRK